MTRKKHTRRSPRTFGVGNHKGARHASGVSLSDKQLDAYNLMEAFPGEWVIPSEHGMRPASFKYLCSHGLAEQRLFPARGYSKFKFRLVTSD